MSFHHWLQHLRSALAQRRGHRRSPRRAAAHRPKLEVLEDRTLPSFAAPVSYAADFAPQAVVAADFNHDGIQDLAVANRNGNSVSILVGNADGTFQAAHNVGAGGIGPVSLAAADFDRDGKPDLVVANSLNPGQVSVLLGNGDGTFQSPRATITGGSPTVAVAVGDFNADGKMDLAVTGFNGDLSLPRDTSEVTVLLAHGDGTFTASSSHDLGGDSALSIATGDFNGDGKLDLVWTDQTTGAVGVQLGNGDGTFQDAQSFATDFLPDAVAVADLCTMTMGTVLVSN